MKIKQLLNYVSTYETVWNVDMPNGKVNRLLIEPRILEKTLKALNENDDIIATINHETKEIVLEY